jgi:hypothetical protein
VLAGGAQPGRDAPNKHVRVGGAEGESRKAAALVGGAGRGASRHGKPPIATGGRTAHAGAVASEEQLRRGHRLLIAAPPPLPAAATSAAATTAAAAAANAANAAAANASSSATRSLPSLWLGLHHRRRRVTLRLHRGRHGQPLQGGQPVKRFKIISGREEPRAEQHVFRQHGVAAGAGAVPTGG